MIIDEVPPEVLDGAANVDEDVLRFVLHGDGVEVVVDALGGLSLLVDHILHVALVLERLDLGEELIDYQSDAHLVSFPHGVLIVVQMAVQSKHVEVHVDGEHGVLAFHVEVCLYGLTLEFVCEEL